MPVPRLLLITGLMFWLGQIVWSADPIAGDLVGLNVSLSATKQLSVCEQLIAGEEWDAAIDLLDKLQATPPESLVQLEPGTYLGLRAAIQRRLCSLPLAGREVYRKRVQSTVQNLHQRSITERDHRSLWRIVDEFAASSFGAEAADRLASRATQRGNLELAFRLWSRLRSDDGPTSVNPVPLYRIDRPQTVEIEEKWLAAGSSLGVRAGHTDGQRDLDSRWVEALARQQTIEGSPPVPGDLIWTTYASGNSPLRDQQRSLSVCRQDDLLLINNGREVRALRQQSGSSFWPTEQPDDWGVIHQLEIDQKLEAQRRELPCYQAGGLVFEDRYLGVLGDAPQWSARPSLVPRTSELVCLDIGSGEGRPLWRVESRNLPEKDWQFHGSPRLLRGLTPEDDLVAVPICLPNQQVELAIAAFQLDDGSLRWWARSGTASADAARPILETQLVTAGGLVLLRTLTGVVMALDGRTGAVQWATTELVSAPIVQISSSSPLIDARCGRVVIADRAQNRLVVLSADSGDLIWLRELDDELTGAVIADEDRLLVTGNRLHAFQLSNGSRAWEHGSFDPLDGGTGVPALIDNTAIWPTRTGLWGLDLKSGQIRFHRQLFTSPRAIPMSVQISPTAIQLATPDELAVFDMR